MEGTEVRAGREYRRVRVGRMMQSSTKMLNLKYLWEVKVKSFLRHRERASLQLTEQPSQYKPDPDPQGKKAEQNCL